MVEEPKARKPLFDGALIGHIHHDRVHRPQLLLGLKSLSWERPAIVTFAPASLARHTLTKPIPRLPRITTTCPPSSFICFSLCMRQGSIDHGRATAGRGDLHDPCISLREAWVSGPKAFSVNSTR